MIVFAQKDALVNLERLEDPKKAWKKRLGGKFAFFLPLAKMRLYWSKFIALKLHHLHRGVSRGLKSNSAKTSKFRDSESWSSSNLIFRLRDLVPKILGRPRIPEPQFWQDHAYVNVRYFINIWHYRWYSNIFLVLKEQTLTHNKNCVELHLSQWSTLVIVHRLRATNCLPLSLMFPSYTPFDHNWFTGKITSPILSASSSKPYLRATGTFCL